MLTDRNDNPICHWCGAPMPDCRLGDEVCSWACEVALAADRRRAAGLTLASAPARRKPPRVVRGRRCVGCGRETKKHDKCRPCRELEIKGKRTHCTKCLRPFYDPKHMRCPECRAKRSAIARRLRERIRRELKDMEIARPRPQEAPNGVDVAVRQGCARAD